MTVLLSALKIFAKTLLMATAAKVAEEVVSRGCRKICGEQAREL
jgi:hypothetical protein